MLQVKFISTIQNESEGVKAKTEDVKVIYDTHHSP